MNTVRLSVLVEEVARAYGKPISEVWRMSFLEFAQALERVRMWRRA